MAFQEGFLFTGGPSLLFPTLDVTNREAHLPFITKVTGLAGNNTELRQYMFDRATQAGSDLVCNAKGRRELVNGTWYDRAASVECTEWEFEAGAQFTVVALCGPTEAMVGGAKRMQAMVAEKGLADDGKASRSSDDALQAPESLSRSRSTSTSETNPESFTFPMHAGFDIWYTATDGQTHVTVSFQSQTIDSHPPFTDRMTLLRVGMLGHTPQAPAGIAEHAILCMVEFVLWVLENTFAVFASVLSAALLGSAAVAFYRTRNPADSDVHVISTNSSKNKKKNKNKHSSSSSSISMCLMIPTMTCACCSPVNVCLYTVVVGLSTYAVALLVTFCILRPVIITNPDDYDTLLHLWSSYDPLQAHAHVVGLVLPVVTALPVVVAMLWHRGLCCVGHIHLNPRTPNHAVSMHMSTMEPFPNTTCHSA